MLGISCRVCLHKRGQDLTVEWSPPQTECGVVTGPSIRIRHWDHTEVPTPHPMILGAHWLKVQHHDLQLHLLSCVLKSVGLLARTSCQSKAQGCLSSLRMFSLHGFAALQLLIITVKLEGVDSMVDHSATVGAPLLLGLLMSEVLSPHLHRAHDP